jgi:indole-3-glycerol phosphate synthase
MASVVEVLSATDIEAALRSPHALIGLRCAGTGGRLDVERTRQLAGQLPSQRTVICLPEVQSPADCAALREICDAVIAGDVLVAADDVAVVLQELIAG